MIDFNEQLNIYLCTPSSKLITCLNHYIDEASASLSVGLNQQYELQFTIERTVTDSYIWFDYLQEGMYLYLETFGLFKMKQPDIEITDVKESKQITAYSCDIELEDKSCTLQLNMGTETSQEYLVQYDSDEDELLLNPYTGIPYDWLVVYNMFPEQLKAVLDKYNSGYYGTPDDNGDITVTDETTLSEVRDLFALIPRLKHKITPVYDENTIITDYRTIEYVEFKYDEGGDLTGIVLFSNFPERINRLIDFYTKYREQLSILSIVLSNTNAWTVGEIYGVANNDFSLANKKGQFDVDENDYSFLTQTFAQSLRCIISFDTVNRKVNITPVDKIGINTGINWTYQNLVNTLNVNVNEDTLATRLYVKGADNIDISRVNFGLEYIDDITYKLNVRDNNGRRIYVDDDLAEKYMDYIDYRESLRADYMSLSKEYSKITEQIYELQYRVPNDEISNDWGTFNKEELQEALITYKNLLNSLITMYKEDYGTYGINDDNTVIEAYMKQTPYWYDYASYQDTILQIESAIANYPYYDNQDMWTYKDYIDRIKAWETEWSLYGIIELQAKIDSYTQNMRLLADSESVIYKDAASETIKTWDELSADEKAEYDCLEANYRYDVYMESYNYKQSAVPYLEQLKQELSDLQEQQTEIANQYSSIAKQASLKNNFTDEELKVIYLLYRDSDYSNENILITSINDASQTVDILYELLQDGKEQASVSSRPQLTFSIDADNLLGLTEYQSFWKDFALGNYMSVQYKDNTMVKVRMIGYEFNPLLINSGTFSVTFSSYVRSKSKVSDLENVLGLSTNNTSSSASGSGSSNGETLGESDDIDVTVSNTMLAKLLNTETFGTRIRDVILDTIDVGSITAKSATFGNLANGTTTIDGRCIQTGWIASNNYNSSEGRTDNTSGSVLNLEDGKFNFGGGSLTWDGNSLSVAGKITADSGNVGGWNISSTKIASSKNIYPGSAEAGLMLINEPDKPFLCAQNSSGLSTFSIGRDGLLSCTGADITGSITATSLTATNTGTIACWTINSSSIYRNNPAYGASGGIYFGTSGLSIDSSFKVSSSGTLTCTDANITGNITGSNISGGSITGTTISGGSITSVETSAETSSFVTIANGNIVMGSSSGIFAEINSGGIFISDGCIDVENVCRIDGNGLYLSYLERNDTNSHPLISTSSGKVLLIPEVTDADILCLGGIRTNIQVQLDELRTLLYELKGKVQLLENYELEAKVQLLENRVQQLEGGTYFE